VWYSAAAVEGCQNRLAGSMSIEGFEAQLALLALRAFCSYGTMPHIAITPLSRQLLMMGMELPETC